MSYFHSAPIQFGASGSNIAWLIKDDFLTERTAGNVNGTLCEPGPGTRTESGGGSIQASKYVLGGSASAEIYITPNITTRTPGRILFFQCNLVDVTNTVIFGAWPTSGDGTLLKITSDTLLPMTGATAGPSIYTPVDNTDYVFSIILASTGAHYLVYDASVWYYLGKWGTGTGDVLWVGLDNTDANGTFSFVRSPKSLWMPQPLAYSSFTQSNGALASTTETTGADSQSCTARTWSSGGVWTVASNAVLNTPVPSGAELITDGDMELAGDVTNWANYGTPTTKEKSGTQKHGGSLSLHLVCDASSEGASQAKSLVANTWYKAEGYIYLVSGSGAGISLNPGNTTCIAKTATVGSWVGLNVYGLENSGSSRTAIARGMDASGSEFYADDISVKALTFTDLIKTVNVGQPDVIVSANFTQVSGTYQTNLAAGLILALDSPTSPANFILVDLRSASKLTIYKCVAGTYSAVGGATIDYTYSAGTLLRCSYNGTTLKVYYNNALVTTQTISDAGIASNTYHGIFNADGSTFDNFEVFGIT